MGAARAARSAPALEISNTDAIPRLPHEPEVASTSGVPPEPPLPLESTRPASARPPVPAVVPDPPPVAVLPPDPELVAVVVAAWLPDAAVDTAPALPVLSDSGSVDPQPASRRAATHANRKEIDVSRTNPS